MSNISYLQAPFNKQRKDKFVLVMDLPEPLKAINKKLTRNNTTVVSIPYNFLFMVLLYQKLI